MTIRSAENSTQLRSDPQRAALDVVLPPESSRGRRKAQATGGSTAENFGWIL